MNFENIKMVVFDMAGTTVDEGKVVYQSVAKALEHIAVHLSYKEIFRAIGGMNKVEGISLLAAKYNPAATSEMVDGVNQQFLDILIENYKVNENIKPCVGAEELFETLQALGIKVVLDTGYYRQVLDLLLSRLGWEEGRTVDYTIASDEVTAGRPAPLMIKKAMAHFGITDPEQVMKVGDTTSDIQEGINAGCKYIVGIESEQYDSSKLKKVGATHTIRYLTEITSQINQLAK